MNHLKSICIISPAIKLGGVERASVNLANELASRNIKVLFISIFNQEHFFTLDTNIQFCEPQGFNTFKLEILQTIRWIRKIVKNNKPDIILGFGTFYSSIAKLATLGLKTPLVFSDRSSPLFKWPIHIHLFGRLTFKLFPPNGAISQTQIAAEYAKKWLPMHVPIAVVPNPVKQIVRHSDKIRGKSILAIGRLNDHLKGFDRLIEVFSLIHNKDWKLVFAGSGLDDSGLLNIVNDLGLEGRVEFLGKVKDIDSLMSLTSIFAIPSRSEGFPNALLEAMAAGLPCISFNFIAGPSDIIDHNVNGIIIEDGDIKGFAIALDYLIENEDVRINLGQEALKSSQRYGVDSITNKYLDFLTQCSSN